MFHLSITYVSGRNFAPTGTQTLMCLLQFRQSDRVVDAQFVSSTEVICPLPAVDTADEGYWLEREMYVSVTHNGFSFGQSHTRFVFSGGCQPETMTVVIGCVIFLFVTITAVLLYQARSAEIKPR